MKFPITRESLQAFDKTKEDAEQKEELIQRMLEFDVKEICNEVVKGMSQYSCEKRFIWRKIQQNIMRHHQNIMRQSGNGAQSQIKTNEYLPRLIEKLHETFIGCDIIADPLQTYLIISWM